ncbi:MAG: hypothetical protein EOP10_14890 [Proteobacteria bacterium]|nr:MAG: hypothetical protein EOP10_14890 [Pseudomonadota bacterium]
MKILACALVAAGLVTACGKIDKTEVTSTALPGSENYASNKSSPGAALVVADTLSLPACNATTEGQLIFVKSQSVFATCVSGEWRGIDVSGPQKGILSSVDCKMTASQAALTTAGLDHAPASGINFAYGVTTFANGSKYVQMRISNGENGLSSGVFWDKTQEEYTTSESDSLVLDVHGTSDFGFWYMSENAELTGDANNPFSIVYVDPTLSEAKLLSFDTAANCKVMTNSN